MAILHRSSTVALGEFRISARDRRWQEVNRADDGHLVVFPGTSVWIAQAGRRPIVCDPSLAVLYNRDQVFRRGLIGADGDHCMVLIVSPDLLDTAADAHAGRIVDPERAPFRVGWVQVGARLYLRQRLAVAAARRPIDPLDLEGELIDLVDAVVAAIDPRATGPGARPGGNRQHGRAATRRAQAELVDAARIALAARLGERLSLDELAGLLSSSPFHLARIFRAATGTSLHAYRDELRLRASLERIAESSSPLTAIGLDLGYASPSHFSDAFRRRFGIAASEVRSQARSGRTARLRAVSAIGSN